MRKSQRLMLACAGLAALGSVSLLRSQVPAPAQVDPASLPAHDTHQGVTVAVRPLVAEASYKERFTGKSPYDAGILALEVFFRNDNDKPIRLKLDTMRLLVERTGQQRQRLEPLSAEGVADLVILQKPPDPRVSRIPLPGPRVPTSNRNKDWQEFAGRMRAAGIPSDVVGPKSTVRGFLYFDVDHHYDWLSDARLDVPDVAFMLNNEALFYFQVDLAPALR
jgi:hypothetical protein